MDRTRLLIADDHALLRAALRLLLGREEDMEVAAEAATAEETLSQATVTRPNLILLDITFPDRSGIALLPSLREQLPDTQVLVLTMHEDPAYLRSALAAGAAGYVLKASPPEVLLEGIRSVRTGNVFVDPALRQFAEQAITNHTGHNTSPVSRLSERERQVLVALAQGLRYQTIADRMNISVKTVETYRARLTAKLGFQNRADLMRFAIESGLLHATASSTV